MNIVIVDDEPASHRVLKSHLAAYRLPMNVVGEALNAIEGVKLIKKHRPELVFLDIEMPQSGGFDLLEAMPERGFSVIFVTAHAEHAITAAHTHPFDYLLKPVDPDELFRTLDQWHALRPRPAAERIEVASLQGRVFLYVQDIVRLEAANCYTTIHARDGSHYVASKGIGHFEDLLPRDTFFRCHHSHLVNLRMVKGLENRDGGMLVMTDGAAVPLASRRHAAFAQNMRF